MSKWKICALCAIVCVSMAGVAPAATWTVYGIVSNSFDLTTGNPSGFGVGGAPSTSITVPNHQSSNQYQIDFYTTIDPATIATGMRGWGNTVMDIKFDGFDANHVPTGSNSLYANDSTSTGSQGSGYNGDSSVIDTNGGAHTTGTTALWGDNSDFGNSSDMTGVLTSIAVIPSPNVNDPRPFVGQVLSASQSADVTGVNPALTKQTLWDTTHNTTYLGTIYVDWNGAAAETLTATLAQTSYEVASDGSLTLDDGNASQGGTKSTARVFNNLTINFQGPAGVPEPASLVILGTAVPCLLLAARRRRRRR